MSKWGIISVSKYVFVVAAGFLALSFSTLEEPRLKWIVDSDSERVV